MKINKILLRISHFFGFRKGEEHIDDVTVNVSLISFTEKERDSLLGREQPIEMANYIKKEVFKYFEADSKLESRCRKTHQVWVTFYDNLESEKRGGSIMKMLYYDDDVLYYPVIDKAAFDRNQKLKEVLK